MGIRAKTRQRSTAYGQETPRGGLRSSTAICSLATHATTVHPYPRRRGMELTPTPPGPLLFRFARCGELGDTQQGWLGCIRILDLSDQRVSAQVNDSGVVEADDGRLVVTAPILSTPETAQLPFPETATVRSLAPIALRWAAAARYPCGQDRPVRNRRAEDPCAAHSQSGGRP